MHVLPHGGEPRRDQRGKADVVEVLSYFFSAYRLHTTHVLDDEDWSVIEAALLPGLIGWGRTREMLLTGKLYSAADAAQMGFVQRVTPADQLNAAVDEWLGAICRAGAHAIRAQKALMNRWQRVSVEEGIYAGIDALASAYRTGEPQMAITAYFASKGRAKGDAPAS